MKLYFRKSHQTGPTHPGASRHCGLHTPYPVKLSSFETPAIGSRDRQAGLVSMVHRAECYAGSGPAG